ncbi:sensor domain-containing diguanylate cyclase [Pseudomonas fuscovaginae UPB0736]|uniref:sensor domain-containing diguanylate cyclase n=1 Tax=Pseudomonas asplenii TaxID=53407 RepID=UPI000494A202|nr:sensor domain-containing diguanylate cyclase [Pseudomonas fuscovaginae]UUQ64928.1 sensor domain-containing diguanylate cyclase [Pseudomonas fuscovaginae UPB0736]
MKRDIHLVVLLLSVIGCSLASLTLWKVIASRERALEDINIHSLNLTQALSTYSESIVRQSSLLLLDLVERLEAEGSGPEQIERLSQLVHHEQHLMPQMSGIAVYASDGRWLMSSKRAIPVGINSNDRAYFIHHRDDPSREPFIGLPIRSRTNQEWVITVSQRFNNARGEFAGVVVVTLGVENFLGLFGQIDVGQEGAIGLSYTDGSMLVRYPFREQDMSHNFSKSPIFTKYLLENPVGTASFTSSLDGVERLYAFRKSDKLPLVTAVALGKREALATWRFETLLSLLVVCGLLLLTGAIGWMLIRNINRRISVESELRLTQRQLLDSNQQLERLAMHDALTGLANRRCFDETLVLEVGRALRSGKSLALLMIDIDHFKRYNDTYGHPAGDVCLQQVATLLSSCLRRPPDLLARYGGEEMAVILPETDNAGASVVAQLMLERLAQEPIPHQGSPFAQVTVSIGIACTTATDLDYGESLLKRADQALYIAKETGRNRMQVDAG